MRLRNSSFTACFFFNPISFLVLLFLLSNCSSPKNETREDQLILDKEIAIRLKSLESYSDSSKQKGFNPEEIHKKLQDLILMAKDIENIKASVNLSNTYFEELFQKHQLNTSALIKLNSSMTSHVLSLSLKQNELNILNQLALQKLNMDIPLKPVY